MGEIEAMVRALHDKQAIRECLANYCRAVDRLDRELLLSCYHEDAVDDHGVFVGDREAFADWALALHARAQTATQHIITNHTCELDGDVAHAETYWMFASMNTQGAALTLGGGRYIDRFERRGGRWAIALRRVVGDWRGQPGEAWLPPAVVEALNSGGRPARDRSDPSYERPLTFDEARRGFQAL
ncbi:MAG: nuclear transport factor 2 family protein [Caulobacterales bacterium]|nr:nuclear transport factor 2 family protein [Caulobacterales bacterium]